MGMNKFFQYTYPMLEKAPPIALITGSARRIGKAIVKYLHVSGYDVIIHYLNSNEEAHALCTELNNTRENSACTIKADLNSRIEVLRLGQQAYSWKKRINLLVNNASLFIKDPKSEDDAVWNSLFHVNVQAPYWLSHTLFTALSKTEGAIINLTDIHTQKPLKHYGLYCQSKAALEMQTKTLAREFAPYVRVNAIAPGAIAWPENENILSKDIQQEIIAQTPLKKHGHPDYIAQAILALVQNPFITGQTLAVDGGRSLI